MLDNETMAELDEIQNYQEDTEVYDSDEEYSSCWSCTGSCSGDCEGGCLGSCSGDCSDSSR